jgi:hypothetical protein
MAATARPSRSAGAVNGVRQAAGTKATRASEQRLQLVDLDSLKDHKTDHLTARAQRELNVLAGVIQGGGDAAIPSLSGPLTPWSPRLPRFGHGQAQYRKGDRCRAHQAAQLRRDSGNGVNDPYATSASPKSRGEMEYPAADAGIIPA